jgi:hypothetical protein
VVFAVPPPGGPPGGGVWPRVRGGGGVPALGGPSVGKREGGGPDPVSVELGRWGGAMPLLEGTTEAARGGNGVTAADETAPVADLPGDAV